MFRIVAYLLVFSPTPAFAGDAFQRVLDSPRETLAHVEACKHEASYLARELCEREWLEENKPFVPAVQPSTKRVAPVSSAPTTQPPTCLKSYSGPEGIATAQGAGCISIIGGAIIIN